MTAPTDAELARAKHWAAMQNPPVTVELVGWTGTSQIVGLPEWLMMRTSYSNVPSEYWAWSALTLALRPIFASVGAVLFEEAAEVADLVHAEQGKPKPHDPSYIEGWLDAADIIEQRIRRLAAVETTC